MRTWTVNVPMSDSTTLVTTVEAFNESEAAELAVKALGITLTPCCELHGPPCVECRTRDDHRNEWPPGLPTDAEPIR